MWLYQLLCSLIYFVSSIGQDLYKVATDNNLKLPKHILVSMTALHVQKETNDNVVKQIGSKWQPLIFSWIGNGDFKSSKAYILDYYITNYAWTRCSISYIIWPASVAQLDAPSDWRPGGRGFNPRRGRQHSFVEIDHEIFSTVILSLPLIQEGQLSVSGGRMCTILVNRLED